MDSQQVFKLIDSILPLEVCLYHQVLPLARQENTLILGMVDPQDPSALDYIRRMLGNLKCSIVAKKISAEQHKKALSAYLNYKGKNAAPSSEVKAVSGNSSEGKAIPRVPVPPSLPKTGRTHPPQRVAANLPPISQSAPNSQISFSTKIQAPSGAGNAPVSSDTSLPPPSNSLPVLKVQATYLSRPLQALVNLPPQQLLQELLGRVLLSGIGRLLLECQADRGRVLWTQEGVLQSVMEDLPGPLFKALVQELKHFFNLPFITVEHTKQVEMERLYNKQHLLLLLQVNPTEHGEEATLQVLRGEALTFYKEQKLADLSQDALTLAKQLQRKLSEIGEKIDPNFKADSLYAIPAIEGLLKMMKDQLQNLEQARSNMEDKQ